MIPNSDHSSTPLTREQVEFVRGNLDVVVGPSLKRQAQHFADTALHLYDENERLRELQSDAELWLAQERAVRGLLAQAEAENERLREAATALLARPLLHQARDSAEVKALRNALDSAGVTGEDGA